MKKAKKATVKLKSRGRPAKSQDAKYIPISIRLHPKIIKWAKGQAKKQDVGYQTVINEALLSRS